LTETRRKIARSVDACIVLGGKESGFIGRYPGVVEEALIALEEETPLFLIGLLGGAAQSIFHVMTKKRRDDLPTAFNEEALLSRPGISQFQEAYNARFSGKDRINLTYVRDRFRKSGAKGLARGNQLDIPQNQRLMETDRLEEAIGLVLVGLRLLRS
jgi:hypothetical protein